jgi:signal peptidase II
MKKYIIAAAILISTLALDIITKTLVVEKIALHERINVLGSFLQLTLTYNRGGLFGILQGYQTLFLIFSVIVLVFLVVFFALEKNKSLLFCNSIALIISGAIGNILDRVMGKDGVVDFIYIGSDRYFRWPAFNVADSVIVVGALLLFIVFYREEKKRKTAKDSAVQ